MTHKPISNHDLPELGHPPNRQKMEQSITSLLEATGFSVTHPHLRETPERVAECWLNDLLDGYQAEPGALLADRYPVPEEGGLVVVRDMDCHGICPHHLLPFFGKVHVAYLPTEHIVGFSRLGQLVRCLTHRLTLQETATRLIAESLMQHLTAQGAGCVMVAQQMCMCLRSSEQNRSSVVTSCFLGEFKHRTDLQQLLYANL